MDSVLGLKLWSWLWMKRLTPWSWGKMYVIFHTIFLLLFCCINIVVVWFQSCQNLARLKSNYNDIVVWFQFCTKNHNGPTSDNLYCPGNDLVWNRRKAITWSNNHDPEHAHQGISSHNAAQQIRKCPGPCLNIKTNFPRCGDSHRKYEDYVYGNR